MSANVAWPSGVDLIVYVGQSANVRARLIGRLRGGPRWSFEGFPFDVPPRVMFAFEPDRQARLARERRLIVRLRPHLNVAGAA